VYPQLPFYQLFSLISYHNFFSPFSNKLHYMYIVMTVLLKDKETFGK
jgi:hypothetical protein